MEIFTYLALVITPAIIAAGLFFSKRFIRANIPTIGVWLTFVGLLLVGWKAATTQIFPIIGGGFRIEALGLMLSVFILFVAGIVHLFSVRYMAGDRKFKVFFTKLGLLTSSLLLMIGADHLILMLVFWTSSNLLLASLMIHKDAWSASRNSGLFMFKLSALGSGSIALAIFILFQAFGTFSLHEILENQSLITYPLKWVVLLLLILAALIQSGCWPFHKWLLSSLNSPTPVSGLMHAGLVNGGGFLLTRFAPLFSEAHTTLDLLFFLGLISVVLGTGWKLVQSNIKGMLACSTMAQMGFMLMQCGLGLFSAAIAHLFWHGLFKCYLFLNSGSAITEKRELDSKKSRLKYLAAVLAGLPGASGFALMISFSLQNWTTQTVLVAFSWLASAQIAYSILGKSSSWVRMLIGSIGSFVFGMIYGGAVYLIKFIVSPLAIDVVMPLHPIHLIGVGIVMLISIGVNLNLFSLLSSRRLYTEMLNLSQSHPKTMTLIRSEYKY
ncbi:MAG: proton-conducting transporter membrane subunit [Chlamydiales bacterium]|nr:proton-conducting transporter membrane subunit [Chlamydiales bacterium]